MNASLPILNCLIDKFITWNNFTRSRVPLTHARHIRFIQSTVLRKELGNEPLRNVSWNDPDKQSVFRGYIPSLLLKVLNYLN